MKPSAATSRNVRDLPSVEQLVSHEVVLPFQSVLPRPLIVREARLLLTELRAMLTNTPPVPPDEPLPALFESRLTQLTALKQRRVINATGILVHTNLGRAPLLQEALVELSETLEGYTNLEFDLSQGTRGKRGGYAELLLAELTQAESVAVTNNCAAALVLIVNSLAAKKEIIISRSELVQIGGGFRIPDILARSGAKLREVGTTNITTATDYAEAVSERTAFVLKVHQSNFVQKGFQSSVSLAELGELARSKQIPFVYDLGSGLLDSSRHAVLSGEPTAYSAIEAGASLVCFSGDKLLAGPQAGVIAGDKKLIQTIKKNPLFRAMRLDKLSLALLEKTAERYLNGTDDTLPVWKMLAIRESDLYTRARTLVSSIADAKGISVESSASQLGGGALPERSVPSVALCVRGRKSKNILDKLRLRNPPIIGRINDDAVYLDLRTVDPTDDQHLVTALKEIAALT